MKKTELKKFLTNNNWWIYFIITFAISWTVWSIGYIVLPKNLLTITQILGAFGPLITALIIIKITEGSSGIKSWLKNTFNFQIHLRWYLWGGLALPFLIAATHHIIYVALGGQSGINFSFQWLIYFAYLIPTALLTGGNEEPGWRGYITPVLLNRFNPFYANAIIGISWAVWHLPFYLLGDWGGNNQPFIWLVIYCIPLSMILTWLFYKSRKSIIPVMLLHAGTNVVFRYFPMETKLFDFVQDEFTLIKAFVYWLFAIVLLVITKGTLGYKKTESEI